jgi:hypothetical protein
MEEVSAVDSFIGKKILSVIMMQTLRAKKDGLPQRTGRS